MCTNLIAYLCDGNVTMRRCEVYKSFASVCVLYTIFDLYISRISMKPMAWSLAQANAFPRRPKSYILPRITLKYIQASHVKLLLLHRSLQPAQQLGNLLRYLGRPRDLVPAPMIIHPPFILGTEMRQLHGARVPWVLDAVNMHRGDIDLEAARKPRVVQPVDIRRLQRRRHAKRIIVPGDLVAEFVGTVPETAVHGLSHVAGLHERFDLLAGGAGLLVQLLTCGVVDFPGGGRDGQTHVGKDVEGDAAADEDGGFEGEGLLGAFVVVV